MAETTQYTFSLKEVTEALIKQQGLESGEWMLAVEFNFSATMAGPNATEVKPSALIQIATLQLTRAVPNSPAGLVVDASKVNTKKRTKA